MVFSSSVFLLYFLPLFLITYFLVSKNFKNWIILIGSIVFYSWGAPNFVFVILLSTYIDFYIVKKLYFSKVLYQKKILLSLSIIINLGLLAYFKYANFFVENVNFILANMGLNSLEWTSVALPIGISFYTFQTLTYSIDIYRGEEKPLEKVSNYMLYILSFPQMIAGPIVRFNSISKQIVSRPDLIDDKLIGFYRFCIGLSKKVLIANVMGAQADYIFDGDIHSLNIGEAWIGIIAYTFQIYFDFSGYSDMAIGLGRMLGFRFPENFNSPYIAKNISEFWRRWHITLGAFMRDYLYIPLGGNRVSNKYRLYFNLWLVFVLSGLWHGASWNFIIWGVYHGLFLILDRLFLIKLLTILGRWMSTLITFFFVMIGWVIFRIEEFKLIKIYIMKLFSFQSEWDVAIDHETLTIFIIATFFSFCTYFNFGNYLANYFFKTEHYSLKEHVFFTCLSLFLFIIALSSITSSGFNPFIYFRF